jgi:hypothetical protein
MNDLYAEAEKLIDGVAIPAATMDRYRLVRTLAADLQRIVPDATDRQAIRAVGAVLRRRYGVQWHSGGGVPNTHLVLTAEELAFIQAHYDGSKSQAIHEAMVLLMKRKTHK